MFREAYLGFLVFLGAGLGGVLRHAVNRLTPMILAGSFPAATMAINIVGSLFIGILAGWFAFRGGQSHQELRLFLTTGLLGGFTTFSAFSLDLALLWERGHAWSTAGYLVASVGLSLIAVFAGLSFARANFA
jgi:CrcB protein